MTDDRFCDMILWGERMKYDENIYVNLTNLNPRANITQFARVIPNRSYAFSRRLGAVSV